MKTRNILLALLATGSLGWFNLSTLSTTQPLVQSQTQNQAESTEHQVASVKPIAQETAAPNGTYVNVNGKTVPRPYVSSSVPIGASAQCRDGSYSFSQHRQGTCSHHGGVGKWL